MRPSLLSHRLNGVQPNWPGAPGLTLQRSSDLARGDIATTHVLEIYNHYGTHCDLPAHFIPGARDMSTMAIEDFVFERARVIDVPLAEGAVLTAAQLASFAGEIVDADLLLIRSGFEAHRADANYYSNNSPGIGEEAAQFIRDVNPFLRGLGIDWLSVCSFSDIDAGVAAHRALLEDREGRFVIIFEDMAIASLDSSAIYRVTALPLLVDGLDGSPCTIISEVH